MKANELMIGDWVECVDSTHKEKVYAQIGAIEEGQTCILVEKDCSNWFLDISFIKPIPLTCEILEKNGFVKDGDVLHLKVNKKMCGDGFEIQEAIIHPRNIVILITCVATIKMQCKYVHQLQNAFTQSEFNKDIVL